MSACDDCLRRTALLGALVGHIEKVRSSRGPQLSELLAQPDEALIDGLGGERRADLRRDHARFDARAARAANHAARLHTRCHHDPRYPGRLTELVDPPAVLHIGGDPTVLDALAADLTTAPAVAVVGARRCAGEGVEVARGLGYDLASAGVCVVSGLALGIDSAAHAGALDAPRHEPDRGLAPTIAVLAGGADVIYPASGRTLYGRVLRAGCIVAELPPGTTPRKWTFPARNRIIAALSGMTVVVQARERSGSLITADLTMQLGRPIGAVPGPVTSALAGGTNALLHDGAYVVRGADDVLDTLLPGELRPQRTAAGADLEPDLRIALDGLGGGAVTAGEVADAAGQDIAGIATALTRLELLGIVHRDPSGRYARSAGGGRALR